MKRVFPLIIVLIALSVLGILFIQMQWIKTAVQAKREQYEQDRKLAVRNIRQSLNDGFLQKYAVEHDGLMPVDETARQYYLTKYFTTQIFTKDEVSGIITKALRDKGIKEQFEFSVRNIFGYSVLYSDHFLPAYFEKAIPVFLNRDAPGSQETLYLYLPETRNYIVSKMGWMIVASIVLTSIIIAAFSLTVRTLFNQKKLSEIKSDFINNMTHELKTPLATISLAVDALTNEKVISFEDKIRYYCGMIKEENKRMNMQVETILQAARIERQEITLNKTELDAHQLIQKVAANLTLQIQERAGQLTLDLKAPKHIVNADEVHLSNIIFNLLDNAIKYSGEVLKIEIETINSAGNIAIRVKDNGIGMNKETQARVFEKFYRAHTGNLHNVKGFGLGLSYVKAMAEAQGGRVRVDSTVGKGSTFTVYLPAVG